MKRILRIFLLFASVVLMAADQTGIPKAQAMFVYNFSRLIEWPANYKVGNFVIGVLGNSTIYNELVAFTAGKKAGTQDISVVKFKDVSEIANCHILFVSFGKSGDLGSVSAKVSGQSTLIIGEKAGFIEQGGAINFIIVEDKLKFQLKSANATRHGLKVSSSLENMAILVN